MSINNPVIGALPRTGATASSGTGDDGQLQKGWKRAATRAGELIDNGDGTVTDLVTGLQWVKQPELIIPGTPVTGIASNQIQVAKGDYDGVGPYVPGDLVGNDPLDGGFYVCIEGLVESTDPPSTDATHWRKTIWTASAADLVHPATFAWADALAACNALEYAGHSDWRLPNRLELTSILDLGGANPGTFAAFPNTKFDVTWWSSTPFVVPGSAWVVNFQDTSLTYLGVATTLYIRPVRGGK